MSFTVMGFSHIKSVFYPRVIHAPKQPFSAFNTDITPTTAGIRLLRQSVAYVIVHFCMYITLPHKLFRSCCCGAADLRQSKALLTSDPPLCLSLSLTHRYTLALSRTHVIYQLVSGAQLTDSKGSFSLLGFLKKRKGKKIKHFLSHGKVTGMDLCGGGGSGGGSYR